MGSVRIGKRAEGGGAVGSDQAETAVQPDGWIQAERFLEIIVARENTFPGYVARGAAGRGVIGRDDEFVVRVVRVGAREVFLFVGHAVAVGIGVWIDA